MKVQSIVVLGAGSAGLMAALTLKRKLPHLDVRVVRSPDIGIIGVGEGTTAVFPRHFFEYLKLSPQTFYAEAEPTWKLGIKFLWGPRSHFFYSFAFEFEKRLPELARNNGFYYSDEFPWLGNASVYMAHDRCFPRQPNGLPQFHNNHAFHIENHRLAGWLERRCLELGIVLTDATVRPETGPEGIAALVTPSGERFTADLYVDGQHRDAASTGTLLADFDLPALRAQQHPFPSLAAVHPDAHPVGMRLEGGLGLGRAAYLEVALVERDHLETLALAPHPSQHERNENRVQHREGRGQDIALAPGDPGHPEGGQ